MAPRTWEGDDPKDFGVPANAPRASQPKPHKQRQRTWEADQQGGNTKPRWPFRPKKKQGKGKGKGK